MHRLGCTWSIQVDIDGEIGQRASLYHYTRCAERRGGVEVKNIWVGFQNPGKRIRVIIKGVANTAAADG